MLSVNIVIYMNLKVANQWQMLVEGRKTVEKEKEVKEMFLDEWINLDSLIQTSFGQSKSESNQILQIYATCIDTFPTFPSIWVLHVPSLVTSLTVGVFVIDSIDFVMEWLCTFHLLGHVCLLIISCVNFNFGSKCFYRESFNYYTCWCHVTQSSDFSDSNFRLARFIVELREIWKFLMDGSYLFFDYHILWHKFYFKKVN